MQIEVSFKHMEQSDPLRDYVTEKLEKVLKPLIEPVNAQAVFHVEKYRHIAKVTVHANGIVIKGKEETNDMYSSIDLVLDKLDRQVKKFKEKIVRHGDREAVREFRASHSVFHEVATESLESDVIKRKEIVLKPITVDEAIMQMELMNKNFLLFNNSQTNQLNVIYVRDDGHFGLIEPQVQE
jgi:putative sigma-54 modulation protein